jgi:hypothetical protein
MRYYIDDVVELIYGNDYDSDLILGRSYTVMDCYFSNLENYYLITIKGFRDILVDSQVCLYKRPIKNWIKFILRFKR